MDPAIMAAISSIPQVFKLVDGIVQNRKANKLMEENVRPTYEMPNEVDQVLQISRLLAARDEMPGQGILEDKLGGQLGNQVRDITNVATSSADAVAAVSRAYAGQQERFQDIGIESARNKVDMMQYLNEVLQYKAAFTDKEWDYNNRMKYDEQAATASAMKQAGLTNIYGGIEGLSRVGTSLGSMKSGEMGGGSLGMSGMTDSNGADYSSNYSYDDFLQSLTPEQRMNLMLYSNNNFSNQGM